MNYVYHFFFNIYEVFSNCVQLDNKKEIVVTILIVSAVYNLKIILLNILLNDSIILPFEHYCGILLRISLKSALYFFTGSELPCFDCQPL